MDTFNAFNIPHTRRSPLLDSNEANCDTAIAQLIHGLDLSFSLSNELLLLNVIKVARLVVNNYIPPSNKAVSGILLDDHYKRVQEKNKK